MFKRKLEEELSKWKQMPGRKPLILRGARQVGKTSLIRQWASDNFPQCVEINLEKKDQYNVFNAASSVADFLKRVKLVMGQNIIESQTLLFIDEIQESKNVLELLRFFAEEKPGLHLITAGSLLEAKLGDNWTIPVGRVDYRYLYPLTFFEFLRAVGQLDLVQELQTVRWGETLTGAVLAQEWFKEYLTVGGMPEVVARWVPNKDYLAAQQVLTRLQTAYAEDIGRYAVGAERKYLELVMEIGPRLAGGLFNYHNFGESGYRSREIGEAVRKAEQVMLLRQIMAINSTVLPLARKYKRSKKLVWLDVGLVNQINNNYQELLTGGYKGKIMEQVVGQTLVAGSSSRPQDVYYWARNKDEGSAEVDYCVQLRNKLIAIEVKAGGIREMKSLFSLLKIDPQVVPIRVSWDQLQVERYRHDGLQYEVRSIPFYLLERWKELIV